MKQLLRIINGLRNRVSWTWAKLTCKTDIHSILFFPHHNCMYGGDDMLNGGSFNVLCLFNDMLRDEKFSDFQLYIIIHFEERIELYKKYCEPYGLNRIHFVPFQNNFDVIKAFILCKYIFTDSTFHRFHKRKGQKVVCLNYFAGLFKDEFFKFARRGGYKKMLHEQKMMYQNFDYHLSCSEVHSKFIALDNAMYYPRFVNLGFPRNDIFFKDNSTLRTKIENLVQFKVDNIITYVPTHRDYERPSTPFKFLYDKEHTVKRTLWGVISKEEFNRLEQLLEETNTLIIAKIHPIQEQSLISGGESKHILYFSELTKHIKTSLNPVLAVSDYMITDYTSAVYDFLYTGRPIIYYFYDYEVYKNSRGFFINPIQSICAGHIAYNMDELTNAIKDITSGNDPYAEKRKFLQELFIKNLDGNATQRIKDYFFKV